MIFRFQYDPNFNANAEVKIRLFKTIEKIYPDIKIRAIIDLQFEKFRKAKGLFRMDMAISTKNKKQPDNYNLNFMNSFLFV